MILVVSKSTTNRTCSNTLFSYLQMIKSHNLSVGSEITRLACLAHIGQICNGSNPMKSTQIFDGAVQADPDSLEANMVYMYTWADLVRHGIGPLKHGPLKHNLNYVSYRTGIWAEPSAHSTAYKQLCVPSRPKQPRMPQCARPTYIYTTVKHINTTIIHKQRYVTYMTK